MTQILNLPDQSGRTQTFALNGEWTWVVDFGVDLTGVAFEMQFRATEASDDILLIASTGNGLLVNGGASGKLSVIVEPDAFGNVMSLLPAGGSLVTDIVATADGHRRNLCQSAPINIIVRRGVTR